MLVAFGLTNERGVGPSRDPGSRAHFALVRGTVQSSLRLQRPGIRLRACESDGEWSSCKSCPGAAEASSSSMAFSPQRNSNAILCHHALMSWVSIQDYSCKVAKFICGGSRRTDDSFHLVAARD